MSKYYQGELQADLASIKDEKFTAELDQIGREIGYGRAQQVLQILWARYLNEQNYPTNGALSGEPPKQITTKEKVAQLSPEQKLSLARKVLGDTYEEELNLEDRCRMWSILMEQTPVSEGCSLHCYHSEYLFGGETYFVYFELGSKTPGSITLKKTRDWSKKV